MKSCLRVIAYVYFVSIQIKHICPHFFVGKHCAKFQRAKAQIARIITIGFILLSFLPQEGFSNTTIVIVRLPNQIVIGADSKASFYSGKTESVCKIYQVRNILLAIGGATLDRKTGFNLPKIVSLNLKAATDIRRAIQSIETQAEQEVKKELELLRKDDPKQLREKFIENENGVVSTIVLAQVVRNIPVVLIREFRVAEDNENLRITIRKEDCPGSCPNSVMAYWVGKHAAIDRFVANNKLSDRPESIVRTLIQLEIDDPIDSKYVGGPIDIVKLTSEGVRWIQSKKECVNTEIKTQVPPKKSMQSKQPRKKGRRRPMIPPENWTGE